MSRSVASIRSAGSVIGSAKLNRARRVGTSPSGDSRLGQAVERLV
jgi:transposase